MTQNEHKKTFIQSGKEIICLVHLILQSYKIWER